MFINTVPISNINNEQLSFSKKDSLKMILVDYILENFTPMFNEENNRKSKQLESLIKDQNVLTDKVKTISKNLKSSNQIYNKELLKQKILIIIYKLYERDVLFGPFKNHCIDIINNLHKFDLKKLQERLVYCNTLLSKNVKKINNKG